MKPLFTTLYRHYPKTEAREAVYARLGWDDLMDHPGFKDTCAIRMSLGLLASGIAIPGATMRVKAGPLKGKRVQARQRDLSQTLKRLWGAPEVYRSERDAIDGIGKRNGVVSFFRIGGGPGGHIDLINPGPNGFMECARNCFFASLEIWFWPLK